MLCRGESREKKSLLIWPQAADIMGPSQSSVSGLLDCQAGFRQCSEALADQAPETRATRQMITHCKRSRRGGKGEITTADIDDSIDSVTEDSICV